MGSTFSSLQCHIVFSTKGRKSFIRPDWQDRLYEYMGGTLAGLGAVSRGIGGVADHVHILAGLKPTHAPADVLRELKKASSAWVHQEIGLKSFAWQEGYAAFSVSPTAVKQVQSYIARQEVHHRKKSFREELIELLKKADIPFEPQFLD